MHGDFTWVDLSTFDIADATRFYHGLFDWDCVDDGSGYLNCLNGGRPGAGLYRMPDFFQRIRMPSFWMTYIAVDDADVVVARAAEMGGKVEVQESDHRGRVALIRDPLGAGFTADEGGEMSGRQDAPRAGGWFWNELFVSSFEVIEAFYSNLFGWTFEPDRHTPDRRFIIDARGRRSGAMQEADVATKGDKEFWGVFFAVPNLARAESLIGELGGEVIYRYASTEGERLLARDPQGAAFFLGEAG